jgi:hypothetical protein
VTRCDGNGPPEAVSRKVNDGYKFKPSDWGLLRLETPGVWLRNTSAAVGTQLENTKREGVFFSRLRLLDMGKIMLSTGNVFKTPDTLHESCNGPHWLVGAATYQDTNHELRRLAMTTENTAKIVAQEGGSAFDSKFNFDSDDDCGAIGTLMTLNAMLLDIVNDHRKTNAQS